LVRRFDRRWRVLLAHLILFDFIYPGHRDVVPRSVRQELYGRLEGDSGNQNGDSDHECHGTLLSATQYLRDVDLEGYKDARLEPLGTMSKEEIAVWTANFMKPH
jgi:hypothetical protein